MGLKFGNPNFDILRKIAFMKNHMRLIKELVMWDRLARKVAGSFSGTGWEKDKCHLQENFWSQVTKPACFHHPRPAE